MLELVSPLLRLEHHSAGRSAGFVADYAEDAGFVISHGTGEYCGKVNRSALGVLPVPALEKFLQAFHCKTCHFESGFCVIPVRTRNNFEKIIYLELPETVGEVVRSLIEILRANLAIAVDNVHLNRQFEDAQREIVLTIGTVAEARSKETSNHVHRVSEYSRLLAIQSGLGLAEAELILEASPFHDIGKVGIPDAILNKPGKLEADEWKVMQTHAELGYAMLSNSKTSVVKLGAIIALTHHEKWDGSGYPRGLAGNDIPLYGRITALADVFDALSCDRPYKKAWLLEEIQDYIRRERGRHFDPRLVDLFFENLGGFLDIQRQHAD